MPRHNDVFEVSKKSGSMFAYMVIVEFDIINIHLKGNWYKKIEKKNNFVISLQSSLCLIIICVRNQNQQFCECMMLITPNISEQKVNIKHGYHLDRIYQTRNNKQIYRWTKMQRQNSIKKRSNQNKTSIRLVNYCPLLRIFQVLYII